MLLALLFACMGSTGTGVRYVDGRPIAIDCHAPTGTYSFASCATSAPVWVWTGLRCEQKADLPPVGGCLCSNSDCAYRFHTEAECRHAYEACL